MYTQLEFLTIPFSRPSRPCNRFFSMAAKLWEKPRQETGTQPGGTLWVKRHHPETLEPRWKGPYPAVLGSHHSHGCQCCWDYSWIHHTQLKGAADIPGQRVWPASEPWFIQNILSRWNSPGSQRWSRVHKVHVRHKNTWVLSNPTLLSTTSSLPWLSNSRA